MSAGWQAIFWAASLGVLLAATFRARVAVDLTALGLALFVVPWLWSAAVAA